MKRRQPVVSDRARVLLVEDESLLAWSIAHALEKEGYKPVIAGSGEDALTALMSETFDAVITDLELPEVDGTAVATVAKKARPSLPVIMISAVDSSAAKRMECEHVIDRFLEKPFDMAEMILLLRECLKVTAHARI